MPAQAKGGWIRSLRPWLLHLRHFLPTSLDFVARFTASNFPSLPLPSPWCLVGYLELLLWCSASCNCLLGSYPLLLNLHGQHPRWPGLDWLPIFMSEGSNNGDSIEISVVLGSLSVTVRGPAQQASQLVSDITRQYSSGPRSSSPAPSESHYSLVDFPPRTVSAGPPCSTFSRRLESREEIERSFDPCPSNLVDSGRRLVGSTISGGQRVHRAWRAGQWAKAVLAGRAASPSRSEQIDLRPRFYVVLRGGKGPLPSCYSSSGSYWKAVGSFKDNPDSLSHSWPSETEARVYCEAAGFAFPEVLP